MRTRLFLCYFMLGPPFARSLGLGRHRRVIKARLSKQPCRPAASHHLGSDALPEQAKFLGCERDSCVEARGKKSHLLFVEAAANCAQQHTVSNGNFSHEGRLVRSQAEHAFESLHQSVIGPGGSPTLDGVHPWGSHAQFICNGSLRLACRRPVTTQEAAEAVDRSLKPNGFRSA